MRIGPSQRLWCLLLLITHRTSHSVHWSIILPSENNIIPLSRSTMSSMDTGASGARTRLKRHSSSFLERLQAVGSRSPRSSQDTLPPPSPGLPSANNIYGSTVQYRLPHLLTTRPPVSRIATAEFPIRKCLLDYGPVLECYSNLSTPPTELSVRVIDDNTRNFVGAERSDFEQDLKATQTTLDERFEARRQ
jgi:hypothetical protein